MKCGGLGMKYVSIWLAGLALVSTNAYAGTVQTLGADGGIYDDSDTQAAYRNEQVVKFHSLATHLGLATEDAVFANPRSFRTSSFNDDRTELEPLVATGEDGR